MFHKMVAYFDDILSKYQCDVTTNLSLQHCLLVLIQI